MPIAPIIIMNSKFEWLDVIDTYKSLIWTERYDEPGDFELVVPMSKENIDKVAPEMDESGNPLDRFIQYRNSKEIMFVESIEVKDSVDSTEGDLLTIKGRSTLALLDRRIIWGQKDIKNTKHAFAIWNLLNENCLTPSDSRRKLPFEWLYEDLSNDPEVTVQYTGDSLLSAVQQIAQTCDSGFHVVPKGDGSFTIQLFQGKDYSYRQNENNYVVFSPQFENYTSSDYLWSSKNLSNFGLIAGEDDNNNINYRESNEHTGGTHELLNRREVFIDGRDVQRKDENNNPISAETYNQLLERKAEEKFKETVVETDFSGESIVDPTRGYQYGVDFSIGDIVQVSNAYGQSGAARVSEWIHSESSEGIKAYPTFKEVK